MLNNKIEEIKEEAKKILKKEFGRDSSSQKERRRSLFPTMQTMISLQILEALEKISLENKELKVEIEKLNKEVEKLSIKEEVKVEKEVKKPKGSNKK